MPLRAYVRPRLVILGPKASVTEAARAIEKNNIGAIVVQDAGRVVGIVTDRDLAVRALAAGLDPADTPLSDVMTSPVATLSPSDSQTDAIALMQKWNVRRIPLVEGERLVGIVTLDDLLLDEAAPIEQLGAIVQSQIGEGGPFDERSPQRLRSLARAEATLKRMLAKVRAAAGFDSDEIAEAALETVLTMLVRRLTPDEAKDLVAQLPSLLHPTLRRQPSGPDKEITRRAIEESLARRLGIGSDRAADVLDAVGSVIAESVTEGQMNDVRKQRPQELRGAFTVRPA
ncbi:MAG TPA: CBS domain-containing protein [Gammaproteobacteria bacterium]